jgi:hypothetical protein
MHTIKDNGKEKRIESIVDSQGESNQNTKKQTSVSGPWLAG